MDGTAQNNVSPAGTARLADSKDQIFGWFRKALPVSFFESVKRDLQIVENSCVFTLTVTSWLMIMQRLSPHGTLATAVAELIQGNGRELLDPCKRVREESVSANTGAYSQARQRMPVEAARRVAQQTFQQLQQSSPKEGLRDRLFLLDGSSIRLTHTPALVKAYPPAENQHGKSRWPVARVAVMHHVVTGLAIPPELGPMYGPEAVSEQGLAERLIDQLPPASVLIGDRNFGVFSVLWHAHRQGHAVLTRLSASRARRLGGGDLPAVGSDRRVVWEAHGRPADRHAAGRHEGSAISVYDSARAFRTDAGLYKERWHIETDLRSLKEQMRLHTIPARSPGLVVSELLMAVASYNCIPIRPARRGVNRRETHPGALSGRRIRQGRIKHPRGADRGQRYERPGLLLAGGLPGARDGDQEEQAAYRE